MEYLSYISPAWATEQMFGITMGLCLPLVVNFPEGPEQVLSSIRELAVEAMTFAPRQWESMASSVQAHMLDAGHCAAASMNGACASATRSTSAVSTASRCRCGIGCCFRWPKPSCCARCATSWA